MAHTTESVPLISSHPMVDPRWPQEVLYQNHAAFTASAYQHQHQQSTLPQSTVFNAYRQEHPYSLQQQQQQQQHSYPNGYNEMFGVSCPLVQPPSQPHGVAQRESSSTLTPPSSSSSPTAEVKKTQTQVVAHPTNDEAGCNSNDKHIEAMLWMRQNWKQHHQNQDNLLQYTKEALLGLRRDGETSEGGRYWQSGSQEVQMNSSASPPIGSGDQEAAVKRDSFPRSYHLQQQHPQQPQTSYSGYYPDAGSSTQHQQNSSYEAERERESSSALAAVSAAAAYHSAAMAAAAVVAQAAASSKPESDQSTSSHHLELDHSQNHHHHQHRSQSQQSHVGSLAGGNHSPGFLSSPQAGNHLRAAVNGLVSGRMSKTKKLSVTGK